MIIIIRFWETCWNSLLSTYVGGHCVCVFVLVCACVVCFVDESEVVIGSCRPPHCLSDYLHDDAWRSDDKKQTNCKTHWSWECRLSLPICLEQYPVVLVKINFKAQDEGNKLMRKKISHEVKTLFHITTLVTFPPQLWLIGQWRVNCWCGYNCGWFSVCSCWHRTC